MRKTLLGAMIATTLAMPAVAFAAVTDAMIQNDAKSTGDVLSWGIGTEGQRYSPLKDINVSNVGKFVVLPKRWIVERTIAWLNRCRRLAKDWERLNQKEFHFYLLKVFLLGIV